MKWSSRIRYVIALMAMLDGYSAATYLPDNSFNDNQFLLHVPSLTNDIPPPVWFPHLDIGGDYFNSDPRWRGEANLFMPFNKGGYQLFYGDIRGYKKSGPQLEGNFSIGYRRLFRTHFSQDYNYAYNSKWKAYWDSGWNMFGAYLGYDMLRSQAENWFNQVSGGFEYWHERFFIGANGYLPFIDTTQEDEGANVAFGTHPAGSNDPNSNVYGHILYAKGRESALPGVDGEVGYNVFGGLNIFAGGYFFHRSSVPTVWGPKATVEYNFYPRPYHRILGLFSRITLDSEVKHDKPRGTTWYTGARFTVNLSHKSDPGLSGVARHMIDPIRRDMDVVAVSYHDDGFSTFQMNGRDANVRYVSTASGISYAANNSDVDIIAVNGSLTGVETLKLATDHDVALTGGNFDFSINGTNYSARNVGYAGILTAKVNNQLIQVGEDNGDVDNNLTIQNIALHIDSSSTTARGHMAISNYDGTMNNTFGSLTLDNVNSTGTLTIILGSGQSTVSVANSTFDISDLGTSASGTPDAAVLFEADSGSTLTISNFSDNSVSISGNTESDAIYGIHNFAKSGGTVIYSGNLNNNTVSVTGGSATDETYGIRNEVNAGGSTMTFNGQMSFNKVTVTGGQAAMLTSGIDNYSTGNGVLTFNNNVYYNIVNASGTGDTYGMRNYVGGAGNIIYGSNANFNFNDLNATVTSGAYKAVGLYNNVTSTGAITFNGSVSSNTINGTSATGEASGVENAATNGSINFSGVFTANAINGSTGGTTISTAGHGIYNLGGGGDITFGTFGANTINATANSGYAYGIYNYAFVTGSTISYSDAFYSNTITATGSAATYGMRNEAEDGDAVNFTSFTDNIITATGSGDTFGIFNTDDFSAGGVNFAGAFSNNRIHATATGSGGAYGIENFAFDGLINYFGVFNKNTITAETQGSGDAHGIENNAVIGVVTFADAFSTNNITAKATGTGAAYGMDNDAAAFAIINFAAVTSNTITANSAAGSAYGVFNDTDVLLVIGGDINYNGAFNDNIITAKGAGVTYGIDNDADAGYIIYASTFSGNQIDAETSAGNVYGVNNIVEDDGLIDFVGAFSGNAIDSRNSGTGEVYGVFNDASGAFGAITFASFTSNEISSTSTSTGNGNVYGVYNSATGVGSNITFTGNFNDNKIYATGTTGAFVIGVFNNTTDDTAAINFGGTFSGNTIVATGAGTVTSRIDGVRNGADKGTITFTGNFDSNTITATGNAAISSSVYNIAHGDATGILTFTGDFNDNTLTSDGTVVTFEADNSGTINIGTITGNTLVTKNPGTYNGFYVNAEASSKVDFTDTSGTTVPLGMAQLSSNNNSATHSTGAGTGDICFVGSGC